MRYIASWSGGKDSTASIILAHENNEPLDLIVFSEVMFDEGISGELPEHIDFIKDRAIPLFMSWGYRTEILRSDKTYMDCFHHRTIRGKNLGMKKGFVMPGHCDVQRDCKLRPIDKFWRSLDGGYTQYIGIAADEQKRFDRIVKTGRKISLLQKYGYTEQEASDLCKRYGLLSPIYDFATRSGCWFCPNASDRELRHLRDHHREYWDTLLWLEMQPDLIGDRWNTLTKTSIHDKEEQFSWEDRQMTISDLMGG